MTDQEKRVKAKHALDFMRYHPAFSQAILGDSLFDGACIYMAKCCKRGKSEDCRQMMAVYRGDEGWENLKHRFEKEWKNDDTGWPKKLQSVYATYKEAYGELWKFDHIEYWYETSFRVFQGNPYDEDACRDYKQWGGFSGPEGGANTFEDALINWARKVRRIYGSFDAERDFLTEAEKRNHKEHFMFLTTGEPEIGLCTDRNPEYINVTNAVINLRWLKWFMATNYCKKQWDFHMDEFQSYVDTLDEMPKERRRLVEKYKKLI